MEVHFTDDYFIRTPIKEVDIAMMDVISNAETADEKELQEIADKKLRELGWTLKEYHKYNRP